MHKLPQPVRLYYLSSFFRAERPQKGRYRQSGRSASSDRLRGPGRRCRGDRAARDAARTRRCPRHAAAARQPRRPGDARRYRDELAAYLRAHAEQLAPSVRERIGLNPLRAFDSEDPATREVMASAPRLLTDSTRRMPSTSPRSGSCSIAPALPTRSIRGSCGHRLLHADGLRVHKRRARRPIRGRRGRALRRARRGPRRAADPGIAGLRGRADPARAAEHPSASGRSTCSSLRAGARGRVRDRRRGSCAGLAARWSRRAHAQGQLKHADRLGARFVAIVEPGRCGCAMSAPAVSSRSSAHRSRRL